jgi:hypothetical protein
VFTATCELSLWDNSSWYSPWIRQTAGGKALCITRCLFILTLLNSDSLTYMIFSSWRHISRHSNDCYRASKVSAEFIVYEHKHCSCVWARSISSAAYRIKHTDICRRRFHVDRMSLRAQLLTYHVGINGICLATTPQYSVHTSIETSATVADVFLDLLRHLWQILGYSLNLQLSSCLLQFIIY